MSGTQDIVIAAGVESMTRVPMGLSVTLPAKEGFGVPMSPAQQKRYPNIQFSQFMGAEMVAAKYGLTKDQLDEYAYAVPPARHRRHPGRRLQGRDRRRIEIADAEGKPRRARQSTRASASTPASRASAA